MTLYEKLNNLNDKIDNVEKKIGIAETEILEAITLQQNYNTLSSYINFYDFVNIGYKSSIFQIVLRDMVYRNDNNFSFKIIDIALGNGMFIAYYVDGTTIKNVNIGNDNEFSDFYISILTGRFIWMNI